jgi:hypothetical protein
MRPALDAAVSSKVQIAVEIADSGNRRGVEEVRQDGARDRVQQRSVRSGEDLRAAVGVRDGEVRRADDHVRDSIGVDVAGGADALAVHVVGDRAREREESRAARAGMDARVTVVGAGERPGCAHDVVVLAVAVDVADGGDVRSEVVARSRPLHGVQLDLRERRSGAEREDDERGTRSAATRSLERHVEPSGVVGVCEDASVTNSRALSTHSSSRAASERVRGPAPFFDTDPASAPISSRATRRGCRGRAVRRSTGAPAPRSRAASRRARPIRAPASERRRRRGTRCRVPSR